MLSASSVLCFLTRTSQPNRKQSLDAVGVEASSGIVDGKGISKHHEIDCTNRVLCDGAFAERGAAGDEQVYGNFGGEIDIDIFVQIDIDLHVFVEVGIG